MGQVCLLSMEGKGLRSRSRFGRDKTRLEDTSQISTARTILLVSGPVAQEKFGKNLGHDKTTRYPAVVAWR